MVIWQNDPWVWLNLNFYFGLFVVILFFVCFFLFGTGFHTVAQACLELTK